MTSRDTESLQRSPHSSWYPGWNWEKASRKLPRRPPETHFTGKNKKLSEQTYCYCWQSIKLCINRMSNYAEIPRNVLMYKSLEPKKQSPIDWSLQLMKNSGIDFRCSSYPLVSRNTDQMCAGYYSRYIMVRSFFGRWIFLPALDTEYISLTHPNREENFHVFFHTAFHEMAHWTAHENRTNRNLPPQSEEVLADAVAICLLDLAGFHSLERDRWDQYLMQTYHEADFTLSKLQNLIPHIATALACILDPKKFRSRSLLPSFVPRSSVEKSLKVQHLIDFKNSQSN